MDLTEGLPPNVIGCALCDLTALYIAGHPPGRREKIANLQIATIQSMVDSYVKLGLQ